MARQLTLRNGFSRTDAFDKCDSIRDLMHLDADDSAYSQRVKHATNTGTLRSIASADRNAHALAVFTWTACKPMTFTLHSGQFKLILDQVPDASLPLNLRELSKWPSLPTPPCRIIRNFSTPNKRPRSLLLATTYYEEAYRLSVTEGDKEKYRPEINSAALAVAALQNAKACKLAFEVSKQCEPLVNEVEEENEERFWILALLNHFGLFLGQSS